MRRTDGRRSSILTDSLRPTSRTQDCKAIGPVSPSVRVVAALGSARGASSWGDGDGPRLIHIRRNCHWRPQALPLAAFRKSSSPSARRGRRPQAFRSVRRFGGGVLLAFKSRPGLARCAPWAGFLPEVCRTAACNRLLCIAPRTLGLGAFRSQPTLDRRASNTNPSPRYPPCARPQGRLAPPGIDDREVQFKRSDPCTIQCLALSRVRGGGGRGIETGAASEVP